MRNNAILHRLAVLAALLTGLTSAAQAAGPLIIFDPATQTPYAYSGVVAMYTDLGNLGAVNNSVADNLVQNSANQWSGVLESSFLGGVGGDFTGRGLPDITGANAGLVIGTDNTGDGIFVIYDTDGTVTQNFLGAPPGVLGVASPEFAAGGTNQLVESWMVLNGATIDPSDLPLVLAWSGVVTHEMGHAINLAHSQTNGAIIYFGDSHGPGGCTPPYPTTIGLDATETMNPFIDASPGSTGQQQYSVEHPDDVSSLADIYPAAGWPASHGTIEGVVYESDGFTPAQGVNVIARNVANPFLDAVSSLSGDFTQGALGADGRFTLTGLTPGAQYVVYIDEIVNGGFSTPPRKPLGAPEEFWNLAEAGYDLADPPCDYSTLVVGAGQTLTADIILNGDGPPPVIGTTPGGFSFQLETGELAADILQIQNFGLQDLNWTLADAQPATSIPAGGAKALDPGRVRVLRDDRPAPTDSRDPALQRACTDCGGDHGRRVTPLNAADKAPGMITDGGFELGPFGGAWNESSTNFGTPLCDVPTCGGGGQTGPHTGNYWCWFGGIVAFEAGSVSQSVVLPPAPSTFLEFYLEQGGCDSPADYMEVLVDGVQVFFVDGSAGNCGAGYGLVSVDISAFADGGSHLVEFRSEVFAANAGVSNFFLDDVSLVQSVSDCAWLSATPTAGTTPGGGSSPVTVLVDATGLAPGFYYCELRIASNDPVNPQIAVPVDLEVTEPQPQEIIVTVEPAFLLPVALSVYANPAGTGNALSAAQLWDGSPGSSPALVDGTIGVWLRDGGNNPVVGFPPELITVQSFLGGWVQCAASPLTADGPTDANGFTTISGPLHAGGHSPPGDFLQVVVNDPLVTTTNYPFGLPGLEYTVNSTDIAGNLVVNLTDVADFAAIYGGGYDYAGDFRRDGVVNLSDVTFLAAGLGAQCPAPPGAVVADAAVDAITPTEEIGLVFDEAGLVTAQMVEPGVRTSAWVVLRGAAAADGVRAFDLKIRASENVTIHGQSLVGDGFDLADGDAFVVGLSDARRGSAGRPLQLVQLQVSVRDTEPAYFWIEPSGMFAQPWPSLAVADGIVTARPASGDVREPVASLNDKDFAAGGLPRPQRLALAVAPNPFNPMTEIRFSLPETGPVELRVFDAAGKLVTTLRSGVMAAGEHVAVWNGTDRNGRGVASGVYFSSLRTSRGTVMEKMMLMK